MTALGAGTGPHVFVESLDAPVLDDLDRHHLARVLRVREGDYLTVSDGNGRWRSCRFSAELEPVGDINVEAPTDHPITIAFALVKGERPELVVQKLTELGVDRIVPFVAARSVVRWDDARAGKHVERLRRVAREAAMQSRRCFLPEVDELHAFSELVTAPGMVLAAQHGIAPSRAMTGALIGPEGGWSAEEAAAAAKAGAPAVAFADYVLRAETAAITAAAVLGALRRGLVQPADQGRVAN